VRPSDTWFGPSPDDGELCYASRTSCRLDLGALSLRPHRALTAVRVKNRASGPLLLERLNLPVVYLPLFCSAGGVLWTRDVTFDYIQGQDYAPLNYGAATPAHADGAELVSPPRHAPSGSLVTRVFSSLFR